MKPLYLIYTIDNVAHVIVRQSHAHVSPTTSSYNVFCLRTNDGLSPSSPPVKIPIMS